MATSIKHKPTAKVTGLGAPTREDNSATLNAKWSIPSSATKESSDKRIQGIDERWTPTFRDIKTKKTRKVDFTKRRNSTSTTSGSFNLTNFNNWTASDGKTYAFSKLYPQNSSNILLDSMTVQIRTINSKGEAGWVTATRKFNAAKAPTMSNPSQGTNTGEVSVTVKPSANKSYYHRHDTLCVRRIYNSRTGETTTYTSSTTTNNDITLSYDVTDRMELTYDQYVRIIFEATSRGFGGPSSTISKTYYMSWPNKPTILGVDVPTASDGKLTVNVDLNTSTEHPTTGVQLEKLVDVSYTSASEIPGTASWQDCGAADDGQCTALSATISEVNPSVGTHTWLRLKVWNDVEDIFYRYSDPIELTELYRETNAVAGGATIISAIPGVDGTSAELLLGWLADSADGTQIAWSSSPEAWRSTKAPETFDVTWDDGQKTIGTTTWPHTAKVYVAGLSEGKTTYFRARRYVETDAGTQPGAWWPTLASDPIAVTPSTQATQVTLVAPQIVARGDSVELTWTYDADTTQAGWQVITGEVSDNTAGTYYDPEEHENVSVYYPTIDASDRIIVAEGTDESGACRIEAERIESLLDTSGSVPFAVRVSTGGEWVESTAVYVTVADPPTLEVTTYSVVEETPIRFWFVCSSSNADISLTVRAQGAQSDSPVGTVTQPRGETIWSGIFTDLNWIALQGGGYYEIGDIGNDDDVKLDFWDGASYSVSATATDRTTGLTSEVATFEFPVNWWRKAIMPEVTINPYDYTDSDSGVRTLGCDIVTAYPTGEPVTPATEDHMSVDDRCDVYRLTKDGATLIAYDIPVGVTVLDDFAPFGDSAELAYRVAIRTPNGAIAWDDFPYQLGGNMLRIDYGTSYVELPYNLSFDNGYDKPFEQRRKLDGSVDGYWTEGVSRKAGLSTDLLKIGDEDTARRVVALGRHIGPCLVRTPDGACYCADVQLTDMSRLYDSGLVAVALDATEVDLTSDYMGITEIPEQPS